ncbi:hypothetical protein [Thermococcus barophilus]|uniref:Uncharacterized protein n=1 Tax=Thermococcus barophilus (strain DSM 11836 / MP) TaxID=391623 RepID=F0LLX0_THEBM|nr:hypothetical protein [Thermococcus barophilus]ADT85069.1 hypothetical protein TERMP_02095 [Thermococcus barophilus MP]
MRQLLKTLITILVFVLTLALPIFYYTLGITGAFNFRVTSAIYQFLNSSYVNIRDPSVGDGYPFYVPAVIFSNIILSKITTISPKDFQFLPILSLPYLFSLGVLYNKMSKSNDYMYLSFAVYITIWGSLGLAGKAAYSPMFPHSWGSTLYPLIVVLIANISEMGSIRRTLILLILVSANHLYSYTSEGWSLFFIYSVMVSSVLIYRSSKPKSEEKGKIHRLWYTLLFISILFSFNRMLFHHFLKDYQIDISYLYSNSLGFFRRFFIKSPTSPHTYVSDPTSTIIHLMYFLAVVFILVYGITSRVVCLLKNNNINNDMEHNIIVLSFWGVFIGEFLTYGIAGIILYRYIALWGAIFVVIFLKELKDSTSALFIKRVVNMLLIFLLIISTLGVVTTYEYKTINISPSRYEYITRSFMWLYHSTDNTITILGDLITVDKYYLEARARQLPLKIQRRYVDEKTYSALSGLSEYCKESHSNYILLNLRLNVVETPGWKFFKPYTYYLDPIYTNRCFDIIYTDNAVIIGR